MAEAVVGRVPLAGMATAQDRGETLDLEPEVETAVQATQGRVDEWSRRVHS